MRWANYDQMKVHGYKYAVFSYFIDLFETSSPFFIAEATINTLSVSKLTIYIREFPNSRRLRLITS